MGNWRPNRDEYDGCVKHLGLARACLSRNSVAPGSSYGKISGGRSIGATAVFSPLAQTACRSGPARLDRPLLLFPEILHAPSIMGRCSSDDVTENITLTEQGVDIRADMHYRRYRSQTRYTTEESRCVMGLCGRVLTLTDLYRQLNGAESARARMPPAYRFWWAPARRFDEEDRDDLGCPYREPVR